MSIISKVLKATMRPYEELLANAKIVKISDAVKVNFPVPKIEVGQQLMVTFICLGHQTLNQEVFEELEKLQLRPANRAHAAAAIAENPGTLTEAPIVPLGDIWVDSTDNKVSPYFHAVEGKHWLSTDWNDEGNMWLETSWFPGVPKDLP